MEYRHDTPDSRPHGQSLEEYHQFEVVGPHIVKDMTRHTKVVVDTYAREELDAQLGMMLDSVPHVSEVVLQETSQVREAFCRRYAEGTPLCVTGKSAAVVFMPGSPWASVAPIDESSRVMGRFMSLDAVDVPIESDIDHLLTDDDCDTCEEVAHEMTQAPVLILRDAYIEEGTTGERIDVFEPEDVVCLPLAYEGVRVGQVVSFDKEGDIVT